VAGGGPATVRREGKVSSTLHEKETTRGRLGRRSLWMKLATAEDGRTVTGYGYGGGAASDSGDGTVGMGRGEAVQTAAAARSERRCAVGTPARGPDSAFNARARGSHAATARCQAGSARTMASDRWDPLISVF
jgi:hypothetical protein